MLCRARTTTACIVRRARQPQICEQLRRRREEEHSCTRCGIATAVPKMCKNSSDFTIRKDNDRPRSSPHISGLGEHGTHEPPLVVHRKDAPFTEEEIERAIKRLQRKLRRFLLHKRTAEKLEAMWELYGAIKRLAHGWRLSNNEVQQFLGAILRAGDRNGVWGGRAQQLLEAECQAEDAETEAAMTLGLLRIHAKFSDVAGFELTMKQRVPRHKIKILQLMEKDDFYETKAIGLARAGLPKQAEEVLHLADPARLTPEACEAFRKRVAETKSKRGQHVWERPVPTGVVALKEIMRAWARSRDVDRAWGVIDWLRVLGYAQSPREWNALLHMHALDPRYGFGLLERVLQRMEDAGVRRDHATYNIVLQGCLLRGHQARWKDWIRRMQAAGFEPDAYTYAALGTQLVASGQWAEALRVIDAMRKTAAKAPAIAAATASAVAAMRIDQQRNRSVHVMDRFRENVFCGRRVTPHEFALVAATALDCPARWTTEIALLIRCLEDGCVEESAVVDSLAARLPSIDDAQTAGRPLLRTLQSIDGNRKNPGSIASAISHMDYSAAAESASGFVQQVSAAGGGSSSGRRRVSDALNVVVQGLLRSGALTQAERLIRAASDASIDINTSGTLLSILHHMQRQESGDGSIVDSAAQLLETTRFTPPTQVQTAQLVASIKAKDFYAAQDHYQRLEKLVERQPSVRAFNALLLHAQATGDAIALENKWRQMETLGLAADALSHSTRIECYSQSDDMLRTRRAYTDMLDHGYPPTVPAVYSMVRCCVRAREIDLALTVVRHAEREHGTTLSSATYNLVLSRLTSLHAHPLLVRDMFAAMLSTSDARLRCDLPDVTVAVNAKRLVFQDLRVLGPRNGSRDDSLAVWLLRPDKVKLRPTKGLKRALAQWLTSRAAFPAAPTLFDTQNETSTASSRSFEPSSSLSPPPDGTTFIILIRAYGQRQMWSDVIATWNALHRFNARVAALQPATPELEQRRVAPFSRMVGWVALALVRLERRTDALAVWDSAVARGIMSQNAIDAGMDVMIGRLPVPKRLLDEKPPID